MTTDVTVHTDGNTIWVNSAERCENGGSTWLNFWNEPTVSNAHKMLDLLKSTKV